MLTVPRPHGTTNTLVKLRLSLPPKFPDHPEQIHIQISLPEDPTGGSVLRGFRLEGTVRELRGVMAGSVSRS